MGKICNANQLSRVLASDAAPAGTLTVSVKGTEVVLGVIAAGVNVHVALGGSELCTHESAMGCRGFPVFAFNERE